MSLATRLVLAVLLDAPENPRYGLELCRAAGLASGTIHPILARLETAGWLESDWEHVDAAAAGRPARRCYRLTERGYTRGRAALAARPLPSQLQAPPSAWGALQTPRGTPGVSRA